MRKLKGVVSHHERELDELQSGRALAIQYLRVVWMMVAICPGEILMVSLVGRLA